MKIFKKQNTLFTCKCDREKNFLRFKAELFYSLMSYVFVVAYVFVVTLLSEYVLISIGYK